MCDVQLREAASHVIAGHGSRGDVEPVPAIDRHDGQRQVRQFVFRKLCPHTLVNVIRGVSLGNKRQRFGPLQRGALEKALSLAERLQALTPSTNVDATIHTVIDFIRAPLDKPGCGIARQGSDCEDGNAER